MELADLQVTRLAAIARDTVRTWRQTASFIARTRGSRAGNGSPPRPDESPHLLLLARFLPPAINGGIYRPTAVVATAARRGWRVTTVSSPLKGEPSPAGLELARSVPRTVRSIRFQEPAPADPSHRFSPRLSGGFETIEPIIQAARRECARSRPSLVMASGPPFAEFVAALVLSSEWEVPLVLDYRDEWTECPFPFVGVGNVDRFWEARCLSRAALVFFTTESQQAHQVRTFGLDPARTRVVPNGWNDNVPSAAADHSLPGNRATVSFLGHLAEHCDLGEFLATLQRAAAGDPALAQQIRVAFVGSKTVTERDHLAEFSPAELVLDVGHVPLSEAHGIMRTSAALLLFNPPRLARYIPGKAYDYIAARRRILVYGEGGELENLLQDYPLAIPVRRGDATGLADALRQVAAPLDQAVDDEFVTRFSRVRSAELQIAALEHLLQVPSSGHAVA